MLWGESCLKTWSKTQATIALSSGEAELAAIVKGSTEAMGIRSLMEGFGITVHLHVRSDATAAIGIVKREGLGKVRHLSVADLWIQDKRSTGEIEFSNVCEQIKIDPADMMTKGMEASEMVTHLSALRFAPLWGRHRLAPQLLS